MEPIGKANLAQEVVKAILNTIKNGNFKPGDRLPPMKELGETLQVGISSVREGLQQLNSMGIIRIVQGKGTYVSERLDLNYFLSSLKFLITLQRQDFFNVMEARKLIECQTARLAAQRASEEKIDELADIMREMQEEIEDLEAFDRLDVRFHTAIAKTSENPVLVVLLESIRGLISGIVEEVAKLPDQPVRANRYHEKILRAVQQRDADGAATSMAEHLADVEILARTHLVEDDNTQSWKGTQE